MGYDIGYPNERKPSITNSPIEQGSTFELLFTITLPAAIMVNFLEGRVIGGVIDTGTTLRGQYRSPITSSANVAFTGTVVKISDTVLSCKLTLTSVQTAAMTAGKGFWDCELVNDDAIPYVFKPFGAGNKAVVVAEATR